MPKQLLNNLFDDDEDDYDDESPGDPDFMEDGASSNDEDSDSDMEIDVLGHEPDSSERKKAGSGANERVGLHSDVSANATMVAVHDKEALVRGSGGNRIRLTKRQARAPQRKRLTLEKKVQVYRAMLEGRGSKARLAEMFDISITCLKNIKRQGPMLVQKLEQSTTKSTSKALRKTSLPDIERGVIEYFELARKHGLPVTRRSLRSMGIAVKEKLLAVGGLEESARVALETFAASEKWARNVIKRNGLQHIRLHGEAGSVDRGNIVLQMNELHAQLRDYEPAHIFNMDETALFYKLMPRCTYITNTEGRKTTRGTKNMRNKDRLIVILCANADGSIKVPIAVIGAAVNPRCFRLMPCPVYYMHQRKAWSDKRTCREWFRKVFVPCVTARLPSTARIALVVDNFSAHDDDTMFYPRCKVDVMTLPPNCTSVHQPMDAGVIRAFKDHYRRNLLSKVLEVLPHKLELRRATSGIGKRLKGISEGHDAHVLDAAHFMQSAWDSITTQCIARCWLKADILPRPVAAEMRNMFAKTHGHGIARSEVDDCAIIIDGMRAMAMGATTKEFGEEDKESVEILETTEGVQTWVSIEDNEDVSEAMAEDAFYELKEELTTTEEPIQKAKVGGQQKANNEMVPEDLQEADDGQNEARDGRFQLPAYPEISNHFVVLEDLATRAGLDVAAAFLYKAKQEFLKHMSTKRKVQTRLNEFFKPSGEKV